MFSFFRTIRARLLFLVLISLLPALGIIVYSGVDRLFIEIEGAKSDALRAVKNFSYDHERVVESTRQFLMTLARVPDIKNLNVVESNKLLKELLKQNPSYGTLFVVNAQGILHASATPLPPTPLSFEQKKFFQDALRTKDFSVGEYGICPVVRQPVLEFSYPIIASKDQFKGVVVVSLNLARYARMFPIEKLPQGSVLSFGDRKSLLMYGYPFIEDRMSKADFPEMIKHMSVRPNEGVFTYTGTDGVKRLNAYRRFHLKPKDPPYLFLCVGIPEEKALWYARKDLLFNVVLLGVAFLIIMFLAWSLGDAIIVKRLKRLVEASRKLGHGDLKVRTGLDHKKDELGEVGKAFDEMAEALEIKSGERERAERELKKIADEWQTTFDSITDLVLILDNECRIVRANGTAVRLFNLPMDRIIGNHFFNMMFGEGAPPEGCPYKRMIETRQHEEAELYIAENERWLYVSVDPILDNDRNVIYVVYIAKDMTDRKRAEEALRESEKKFRDLAEKSPVGVYIVQDGVFKYANAKVVEHSGYSVEELIDKMGPKDFVLPEDWPRAEENIRKRLSGEVQSIQYELKQRTKDNKIITVEVYGSRTLYQGRPAVIGTSLDITDRKRAEEALRESEKKFRDLAEKSLVGIYIVQDGVFKYANAKIAEQRGYTVEELIDKKGPKDFLLPEDIPIVEKNIRKRLSGEVQSIQYEFRERTKENKIINVEVYGSRTLYQGRPAVIGTSLDITDRKRTEEKLRESEEIFHQLAENIREVFYIYEQNSKKLRYVSPAYTEIWGRTIQSIYEEPKSFLDTVHPEDRDRVRKSLKKKSLGEVEEVYRIVRPDGSIRWIKDHSFPIHDHSGKMRRYAGITADITDLKLGEEKLKYLSHHDPLTGLYNRIYFREEMSRMEKLPYGETAGIVLCDVDGLKLINDTFGHDQGDNLLIAAARVIRTSFCQEDLVARIGGDEFAILLPKTTELAVENACQRIQETVASYNVTHPELPLSISVGSAVNNGDYRNVKDLFKEADMIMYRKKLHRIQSIRSKIINTLVDTLKAKNFVTDQHTFRLEKLLADMTTFVGLPESTATHLSLLARFYDIGKVGVPDSILLKKGSLTPEEWMEMKRHCEIGYRIAMLTPELAPIADWILKHHEWWNGQGYPLGIKEEEIPVECRLFAIVDAYEAMMSVRPYRRAFSHTEAITELLRLSGKQFDPKLLDIFLQMLENHPPQSGSTTLSAA